MSKVVGIKQYHHFSAVRSKPGTIQCCVSSDSDVREFDLLKKKSWQPDVMTPLSLIPPKGLDNKRQWYLYEKNYCTSDTAKNRMCPLPSCPGSAPPSPQQFSFTQSSMISTESLPTSPRPPPTKKQRVCGKCLQPGHNSRTCSNT